MWSLIVFNEGKDFLAENGWPETVWFLLSEKPVAQFAAADGLAEAAEVRGTGYGRRALPRPLSVNGVLSFDEAVWETGNASDWKPARSIAACSSRDQNGYLLCAWDLQESGEPRDLSRADTTERAAPIFSW